MKAKVCIITGFLCIAIGIFFYEMRYIEERKEAAVQERIASEILRLHVIANSDTEADQALKLKVKDQIVGYLKQILKKADTLESAKKIVEKELGNLEVISDKVIKKEGYEYSATASLGNQQFPIKMYGDLVFPAGEYQALQIKIGESKGKNWWCVLFPSLCFIDGTYSIVPEESKEELQEVIGEKDYQTLLTTDSRNTKEGISKIEIKWKIEDWLKKGVKEVQVP